MDNGNRIRMYGATIHRSTIELYPHGAGGENRTPDAMIMVAEMRFELIIFIPRTSGATIRHYHSAIQPKSCALPTELHPHILFIWALASHFFEHKLNPLHNDDNAVMPIVFMRLSQHAVVLLPRSALPGRWSK